VSLTRLSLKIEKAKATRKDDPLFVYSSGMAYAAAGKEAEAREIVQELERMGGTGLNTGHWIAKICATLNDKDRAIEWLERVVATGSIGVFYEDDRSGIRSVMILDSRRLLRK